VSTKQGQNHFRTFLTAAQGVYFSADADTWIDDFPVPFRQLDGRGIALSAGQASP
jgi:hypothetical protein